MISTPEGVQLALPLAGLATRFMALTIDLLIGSAAGLIAILFAAAVGGDVAAAIVAASAVLVFYVGYHVLFEVAGGGRTVGKRAAGLRVVRDGGAAVGLRRSLIRNLMRLIEGLPLSYVPAIVSILVTRSNQRLGDLAAGTVVMHEAGARAPTRAADGTRPVPAYTEAWDVSTVTPQELAAVRDFLRRRSDFTPQARGALAERLAAALRGRVAGVRSEMPPERFLEDLAAAKASRR